MVHGINPSQGAGGMGDAPNMPLPAFSKIYGMLTQLPTAMQSPSAQQAFKTEFESALEGLKSANISQSQISFFQSRFETETKNATTPQQFVGDVCYAVMDSVAAGDHCLFGQSTLFQSLFKQASNLYSDANNPSTSLEDVMKSFATFINTFVGTYPTDYQQHGIVEGDYQNYLQNPTQQNLNTFMQDMQGVFAIGSNPGN